MCIQTLQDLLDRPFKTYTAQDQAKIVKRGRFTDPINMRQSDKNKNRQLHATWFQKVEWLASNTVNNKLYCWTCVLFPWHLAQGKLWWQGGFEDLKNMTSAVKKHESSTEHIYSTVKHKVFIKRSLAERNNITLQSSSNPIVAQKERDYLKRVIDLTTYVVKLKLPSLSKELKDSDFNSYKGLMSLLKKYDIVTDSLDVAINPTANNLFQVGIAKSMVDVIRQQIAEEINQSRFFSCVVDEVPNTPGCKKIAISLRYVYEGSIFERCIGIFDVEKSSANDVYAIIDKALSQFDYKTKLISQSYDGAIVPSIDLFSLQQNVKKAQTQEMAQLLPCYSHDFCNIVLPQALRSINECKTFFAIIDAFKVFLKEISKSVSSLNLFSTLASTTYTTIEMISISKDSLITLLSLEMVTDKYDNTPHLLVQMNNIIVNLKSSAFLNCLRFFQVLFKNINFHINKMCANPFDTKQCYKIAADMIIEVKEALSVTEACGTDSSFQLFKENVIQSVEYEIKGRFLDMEQLEFFYLLPTGKKNFSGVSWSCLKELFGPKFFDLPKLRTELDMYYYDTSICGPNLGLAEMLKSMYSTEVYLHLPELYTYFCLLATMPSIYVPIVNGASERVRLYYNNVKYGETKLDSELALLVLEENLFESMEKDPKWCDKVIERFMNNINSRLSQANNIHHTEPGENEATVTKDLHRDQIVTVDNIDIKYEDVGNSEVDIKEENMENENNVNN